MKRPSKDALVRYFQGKSEKHEAHLVELYLTLHIDEEYVDACLKDAWKDIEDFPVSEENIRNFKTKFHLQKRKLHRAPMSQKRRNVFYAMLSLLIISGISLLIYKHQIPTPSEWISVHTAAGQQKEVTLPDGSLITLNGGSTLKYLSKSDKQLRLVQLDGEGYFDVAKDQKRPFVIVSDSFTTQVVGTTFTIDSEIDKSITVFSGKVNVTGIEAKEALKIFESTSSWTENTEKLLAKFPQGMLSKGQKALWEGRSWTHSLHQQQTPSLQDLTCINQPLHQIISKYQRIYGQEIMLDPSLASKRLTIVMKYDSPEENLEIITQLAGAKLIKNKKSWIIKK